MTILLRISRITIKMDYMGLIIHYLKKRGIGGLRRNE